jgi:putative heme iron utilization protein
MAIAPGPGSAQGAGTDTPGVEARRILRAARAGSLATAGPAGQPFASLVTPAVAPDGAVLLLLSDLSEHTRHLQADRRCSLLAVGAAAETNPQTAPRVTVTGMADPDDSPALKARYLAVHPYAALYAGFADFRLWRIAPMQALLVGGFARAVRLRAAELAPDADAVAAIAAAEASIMAHCNEDHPDALARIAGGGGAWRMVGVDVDGCDLAQGEVVRRIAWSAPVASAADVRRELVQLSRG